MNDDEIYNKLESNVRYYSRVFPCVFQRGEGEFLYDTKGNKYIDFFSGAGALNYGHNNPVLKEQLINYLKADGITHSLDMSTTAKNDFLLSFKQKILDRRNYNYLLQFTGPTGTNAIEASLKLARKIKKREQIISFTNSFHGVTLGALATTSNSHHRNAAGLSLNGSYKMPYYGYLGDTFDSINYLDKVLSDTSSGFDLPAAVIVETVQGEGGINVASFEWLRNLEILCRKYDILLIVDDIQAGCGRTGSFFSFEKADINPDIITLSKSLSGYGTPFSLVLINPELDFWKPGEHNGTFRGNNLAFITAKAAIDLYWSNSTFEDEIQRKGSYITNRLHAIVEKHIGEEFTYTGRGMFLGLNCKTKTLSKHIVANCFNKGLLVETCGSEDQIIKLMAPLTITQEALEKGLDIFETVITNIVINLKK